MIDQTIDILKHKLKLIRTIFLTSFMVDGSFCSRIANCRLKMGAASQFNVFAHYIISNPLVLFGFVPVMTPTEQQKTGHSQTRLPHTHYCPPHPPKPKAQFIIFFYQNLQITCNYNEFWPPLFSRVISCVLGLCKLSMAQIERTFVWRIEFKK